AGGRPGAPAGRGVGRGGSTSGDYYWAWYLDNCLAPNDHDQLCVHPHAGSGHQLCRLGTAIAPIGQQRAWATTYRPWWKRSPAAAGGAETALARWERMGQI